MTSNPLTRRLEDLAPDFDSPMHAWAEHEEDDVFKRFAYAGAHGYGDDVHQHFQLQLPYFGYATLGYILDGISDAIPSTRILEVLMLLYEADWALQPRAAGTMEDTPRYVSTRYLRDVQRDLEGWW